MLYNYEDHQAIIYRLAHKWKLSDTVVDFQELVSVGNEEFITATKEFNPNKGTKFTTYLWQVIDNAMNDVVKKATKEMQNKIEFTSEPSINGNSSPERMAMLKSWVESLSQEGQFIVNTVWNTPAEIVQWAREESYNPKVTMKLLSRYLRGQGWAWKVVRRGFKEVQEGLKNF